MKVVGIIPARFASTRFPGKPLTTIDGKAMIQRVYEQTLKSTSLSEVIVATDDMRIVNHVQSFGGNVMLTDADHQSGTDRCAEVLTHLTDVDIVVNIQGDEPYINPIQINQVVSCFENKECQIATLIKKIETYEELVNPNRPKAVVSATGKALYFSRSPIPHIRAEEKTEDWINAHVFYKHIGLYAYQSNVLLKLSKLHISPLEIAESLEQLRWLENGFSIYTSITEIESQSVDIPEDVAKLKK